jgi:hypothetical protein
MEVTEIKTELHQKIDSVDAEQLKQIYGLINNYITGSGSEDWDAFTEIQKAHILKGLEQADAGIGNSLTSINKRLRAKYGING